MQDAKLSDLDKAVLTLAYHTDDMIGPAAVYPSLVSQRLSTSRYKASEALKRLEEDGFLVGFENPNLHEYFLMDEGIKWGDENIAVVKARREFKDFCENCSEPVEPSKLNPKDLVMKLFQWAYPYHIENHTSLTEDKLLENFRNYVRTEIPAEILANTPSKELHELFVDYKLKMENRVYLIVNGEGNKKIWIPINKTLDELPKNSFKVVGKDFCYRKLSDFLEYRIGDCLTNTYFIYMMTKSFGLNVQPIEALVTYDGVRSGPGNWHFANIINYEDGTHDTVDLSYASVGIDHIEYRPVENLHKIWSDNYLWPVRGRKGILFEQEKLQKLVALSSLAENFKSKVLDKP